MSFELGKTRARIALATGIMTVGLLGSSAFVLSAPAGASDNLSCPQGTTEYKVASNPLNGLSVGESASFTVNGETFTFTKVVGPDPFGDDTFDFTSTIAVSVVFVKGGVDTNTYNFVPAATSGSGLHPPLNGGEQAPVISHVVFCIGAQDGTTTTSTVPATTSTVPETTSTVPETTSTVPETTSTVPETTSTVPETTSTVPETTSTVPETTSTVPETTVPETTSTVPEETTSTVPETTTTIEGATSTLPPTTTTTIGEQGSTVPDPTTTTIRSEGIPVTTTTPPSSTSGSLPFTGSQTLAEIMFALSCIAGGGLAVFGRRKSTERA